MPRHLCPSATAARTSPATDLLTDGPWPWTEIVIAGQDYRSTPFVRMKVRHEFEADGKPRLQDAPGFEGSPQMTAVSTPGLTAGAFHATSFGTTRSRTGAGSAGGGGVPITVGERLVTLLPWSTPLDQFRNSATATTMRLTKAANSPTNGAPPCGDGFPSESLLRKFRWRKDGQGSWNSCKSPGPRIERPLGGHDGRPATHRNRFACIFSAAVGRRLHSPEQDCCYKFRDRWSPVALPPPARLIFLVWPLFGRQKSRLSAPNGHFFRRKRTTRTAVE